MSVRGTYAAFFFAIFLFLALTGAFSAHAATVTWVATSASTWNTSSSWSTGAVPGPNDLALFSGSSTQNSSLGNNVSINVGGIEIDPSYTGTISQGYSMLTVGALGFSQSGGTFTGGNSPLWWADSIVVNGPFSVTGGTFTSTANTLTLYGASTTFSSSFQPNGGTVLLSSTSTNATVSGSSTFYDLWFGSSYNSGSVALTIATGTTLTVNASTTFAPASGNLALSGGGVVNALGDVLLNYVYQANSLPSDTVTLMISGMGTQTISDQGFAGRGGATGGQPFILPSIVLNKPSGSLNISGVLGIVGSWTNNNSSTVSMNMGTSTVIFLGPVGTITGSTTFFNLGLGIVTGGAIDGNSQITIATGTVLTVKGDLIFGGNWTSCAVLGGAINVEGNIDGTYVLLYATSTVAISLTGSGTQIIDQNLGEGYSLILPNLTINKPSGMVVLANTFTVLGNWTNNGTTIDPGSSTVNFGPTSYGFAPCVNATITGSSTFNNLAFGANGAICTTGSVAIASDTVLTAKGYFYATAPWGSMQFNGGEIDVQGNIEASYAAYAYATSTTNFVLNGTSAQVIGDDTAAGNGYSSDFVILPNLTINKPFGTVYAVGGSTIYGNVSILSGELQLATGTVYTSFRVNGALTVNSGARLSSYPSVASSTLILGSSTVNNGVMFFDGPGQGCGTPLPTLAIIKSTRNGTARAWSGSGTFWMRYVDVRDQDATAVAGGITDWNGYNRSNNTNWTFPTGPRAQLIQQSTLYTAGSSLTLPPFTLTPRAGDLVLVAVSASNQSLTSSTVTDNASNTYMLVTSSTFGSAPSYALALYYAKNINSTSSFTVSVTGANGSGGPLLTASAFDYTDMSGTTSLDSYSAHIDTTGLATALTSLSAVAVAPGDLYFGLLTTVANTTPTGSLGWNTETTIQNAGNAQSLFVQDMATSTILTTSSQWTSVASTSYAAIVGLFETPHPGSYAATGTLDSVTFDTGVSGGATLNSFVWQGSMASGTAAGFQFAVSNSSSGPWNFTGPAGIGGSSDYFSGSPGTSINLTSSAVPNGYALFAGYRYFRYRALLFADPQQIYTPTVTQVTVNWSP